MKKCFFAFASIGLVIWAGQGMAKDIVHDAEFYVLKAQHGDNWAAEDKELDAKLAALEEKFGAPPNIVHIMVDDTAFGEVGFPAIQQIRGYSTPNINELAAEGINFLRMYTEIACTQSRSAAMTGRMPSRNGMFNVGFPYEYGGLAKDEVTMGEVLSEAGYATGFFGKWHLGDVEESYATNQGFDEALWTPYNQVPSMYLPQMEAAGALAPTTFHPEIFPEDPYDIDKGWRPKGTVWHLEGTKGGEVREFLPSNDIKNWYAALEQEEVRTMEFIEKNAAAKKPFYVSLWPSLIAFGPHPDINTLSRGFLQEGLARLDPFIGNLMERLQELGIAENTLVIFMADNGPMTHNGPPGMVEVLFRGGKGDYLEGGVRVAAMAWWPGMIEPGQSIGDIIHITDLFTTFARLGGATENIPTDRIIDGIDQTALFLNGDSRSRRDYVHIYTGEVYAATVKGRFKRHWVGEKPGLSGASFYDLYNDPREVQGMMLPMFPTKGMFNTMKARHDIWIEKYPNIDEAKGLPFTGIANARPETIKASKPRFGKGDVPFDVEEVMKRSSDYEDFEADWGIQ
jgi:arylsulfatase A-like enzyme